MSKRKTLNLNDRMCEMIKEMKEARGYPNDSAVIYAAIIDMHTREFPPYKKPSVSEPTTPEDKVRQKQQEAEVRERMEREQQVSICEELGGEVFEDATGHSYCRYFTYAGKKRYEQEVSIDQLTEDLVKVQYQPDKETVLRLQEEGKTSYND